jgi:serine/threonine protein kinase/DNA-binding response OmpR family regulator
MEPTVWNPPRPTTITRDEFIRNLTDSGLWPKQEIDKAIESVSESAAIDGDDLARQFVAQGKLTFYQAESIRDRKFAELVIGNYEVLDRLGAGGMGTVYRARHRRMKRIVALKVLAKNLGRTPVFVQRFQREVETVARLSHPHIVMAFDADEAEAGHFLVMEFVNGRDLATEVQERGPMSVREAVNGVLQAARAMEYAHSRGIVHRDIKPANLLRDVSGVVKVADLGLARLSEALGKSSEPAAGLTQAGGILGTADFMPPEQALDSTTIDHRADVYSLGCTLYYLLTKQVPYPGTTLMEILLKHRDAPIPALREARPDVPPAVDAIYRQMVAKKPGDRFQLMSEVVQALESIESSLGEEVAAGASIAAPSPTGASLDTGLSSALGPTGQTIELQLTAVVHGPLLKVLLVEPSRTQSAIIRKYLNAQGVQDVVAVAAGQEALKLIRSERLHAIISALHLPDMTGVQLAQQIRAEGKSPAPGFVLISSEAESSDAGTLNKCGNALVLKKPFTPEKLVEALRVVSAIEPPRSSTRECSKLRVLIVDDSGPARMHVRGVLSGLGFSQFVEAADGAQAVAAVAGGTFDLIVTDYNMPYMDGRGLVGYLKQNPATASIPIIMVTSEQDPGKLAAVRQLGVTAVCDKSFAPEVVQKIIDQLVKAP